MEKADSFWEIFDDPVVQAFAFSIWGAPLYVFMKWIQESMNGSIDLLVITDIDHYNIAGFIEWFGVPYGLILALVLVNVWTQFDTTERAFDREADSVLTLFNTFLFANNKLIKITVAQKLIAYMNSVRANPEPVETGRDNSRNEQEILLREISTEIAKLLQRSKKPQLPMKLLDLLNNLVDSRGDRLSHAKQRLPQPVKYLSIVASIAWLMPFFALKFDNPLVGPFLIVAVTLVVVSILLIIEDLDNPIGGAWGVKFNTWEKIEKTIESEINRLQEDTAKN